MCCTDGSMFATNAAKRVIKFACTPTGPSLNITNGASIIHKTGLCDISNLYDEYVTISYLLKGGQVPQPLIAQPSTFVDATYLLVTVDYINNSIEYPVPLPQYLGFNETPYLSYTIGTDPSLHNIDNIMLLTGTPDKPIDIVTLINNNTNFDANINIVLAKKFPLQ